MAWAYSDGEMKRALEAVEFILDHDGYYAGSKGDFAGEMDWLNSRGNPDRRMVERVCNLTRDQSLSEPAMELLGGAVISYAPTRGGMVVWMPTADADARHWAHGFLGDLQRQQQHRTENRRRLEDWRAFYDAAWLAQDQELARLVTEARAEIDRTGFVTESTTDSLFQTFRIRGWL